MKKARLYLRPTFTQWDPVSRTEVFNTPTILEAIEKAQIDAYNQAIDDATENATVDVIDHEELHINSLLPPDDDIKILPIYGVDLDSILELKK